MNHVLPFIAQPVGTSVKAHQRAGADKTPALFSGAELEALLTAHGFLDGHLAVGAQVVVPDVELCRQRHALKGKHKGA